MVADELYAVLARFHREIVIPEMESLLDTRVTSLRDDMLTHFDAIYKRFDRLETEHYALSAAVKRLED